MQSEKCKITNLKQKYLIFSIFFLIKESANIKSVKCEILSFEISEFFKFFLKFLRFPTSIAIQHDVSTAILLQ